MLDSVLKALFNRYETKHEKNIHRTDRLMFLSAIHIIQILIVFQCFFITVFLFNTQKGKVISNLALGFFLLIMGAQFLVTLLIQVGWTFNSLYLFPLKLLYGPLIYFFTRSIVMQESIVGKRDSIHLLPVLISGLLIILGITLPEKLMILFVQFSLIGYLIISIYLTVLHKKVITSTHSNVDEISLGWLTQILAFLFLIITLDVVNQSIGISMFPKGMQLFYIIQLLVILSLVTSIVYKGLKYPELFKGITREEIDIVHQDTSEKYKSSSLSTEDLQSYREKLEEIFDNQKPYLDPELTLNELAGMIGVTSRNLSYIINSQFEMKFSDLINKYRVIEAVRIFEENNDPKQTILEVVYEVGFNSKSSFYLAFKKNVGKTPKEFKRDLVP